MTSPLPGWYRRRDEQSLEEWWDGEKWSEVTRPGSESPVNESLANDSPVNESLANEPPVNESKYAIVSPAPEFSGQRANPFAVAALWCGLGSLLINPLLIPSVCAIVFGGLGVHRATQTGIGKPPAVVGLVLGIIGALIGTLIVRNALSMF